MSKFTGIKIPTIKTQGAPITVVIPKPTPTAPQMPILQSYIPMGVNKKKKKEKIRDFNYYLNKIKDLKYDPDTSWEDEIDQETILADLFEHLEPKEASIYILNKLKVSRFKSFSSALNRFSTLMDNYFSDAEKYKDEVLEYLKKIPQYSQEHFYFEFNELRISIIRAALNMRKDISHLDLANGIKTIAKQTLKEELDYQEFEKTQFNVMTAEIIELTEKVFPEEGKALKILFGGKNG